jgi:RNase adaptor protein for sRNA GlmZ degradation
MTLWAFSTGALLAVVQRQSEGFHKYYCTHNLPWPLVFGLWSTTKIELSREIEINCVCDFELN